jgi:hypothetical protein
MVFLQISIIVSLVIFTVIGIYQNVKIRKDKEDPKGCHGYQFITEEIMMTVLLLCFLVVNSKVQEAITQ